MSRDEIREISDKLNVAMTDHSAKACFLALAANAAVACIQHARHNGKDPHVTRAEFDEAVRQSIELNRDTLTFADTA